MAQVKSETVPAPIEQIARDAELLPCPRCGYATNLHEDVMAEPMTFQPYCANDACGLQGKIFNNPFEAIKHWNRRQACGQQPVVPKLTDEAWKFIQDECSTADQDANAFSTFEGDWGNWNWLLKEIYKRCIPTPPVQQAAPTAAQLALEELGRFAMVWRNSDIYVHPILSREEAVKRGCADLMDAVDKYASLVCVAAAPHPVRGGGQ